MTYVTDAFPTNCTALSGLITIWLAVNLAGSSLSTFVIFLLLAPSLCLLLASLRFLADPFEFYSWVSFACERLFCG